MIPCIANKCILYPLCINKTEIYCDTLYDYFSELTNQGLLNKESWDVIHKKLRAILIYSTVEPLSESQEYPTNFHVSPIKGFRKRNGAQL